MSATKIEWTEYTWNPVTGCTPVSDGCLNCYARRMAKRLTAMGNRRYKNGFKLTLHYDLIQQPLKWRKTKIIFVNSMSDLFHEGISISFIKAVFNTIERAPWHIFQVLTKRAERLAQLAPVLDWPDNLWVGVTIESEKYLYRASLLKKVPAKIRFISFEPLIGSIANIDLNGIDWAIVGGESGPGSRIMRKAWVERLLEISREYGTSFFFKQWGGVNKKKAGRLLNGRIYNEIPEAFKEYFNDEMALQKAA